MFSPALLGAPLAIVVLGACGSRTELQDDRFFHLNGDGGPGSQTGPIDGAPIVDSSVRSPPRTDAGKLLGCVSDLPGPTLIEHHDYFGTVTCIDATEVTNADYAAFLQVSPAPTNLSPACSSKRTYVPSAGWPAASGHEDYPVVNVDWCDAQAFCRYAGKDLCANHGNEPGNPVFAGDPQIDEWSAACNGNRAEPYPYGKNFDIQACNGLDLGLGGVTPVRIPPGCEGSDNGVFGMSGNAWEWENACDDDVSPNGDCLIRGGSFRSDMTALRCDSSERTPRTAGRDDVGFRCCVE